MSNIEYRDEVTFQGQTYMTREVEVKGYGFRTIAPTSLSEKLLSDGNYVSDEARAIDEGIFYYLDDARFNNYSTKELMSVVSREAA